MILADCVIFINMSYTQDITRLHRALFVIAIDQSGSMSEYIDDNITKPIPKSHIAAMTASMLIDELYYRAKSGFTVKDYYDIIAIGYSNFDIKPLLHHNRFLIPIYLLNEKEVNTKELVWERITEDGRHLLFNEYYNEWIKPHAAGTTPMAEMFTTLNQLVRTWCEDPRNRDSFPPIIFHITDGRGNVCKDDIIKFAKELQQISTTDGHAILFNIHITSTNTPDNLFFPNPELITKDHPAALLADISTILPERFHKAIYEHRPQAKPPFLSLCFNATIVDIMSVLNIGSYSAISNTPAL